MNLNDPWLRFLWDLRGTYNGTLIDFEARREELEAMFHEKPRSTTLGTGRKLEQCQKPAPVRAVKEHSLKSAARPKSSAP